MPDIVFDADATNVSDIDHILKIRSHYKEKTRQMWWSGEVQRETRKKTKLWLSFHVEQMTYLRARKYLIFQEITWSEHVYWKGMQVLDVEGPFKSYHRVWTLSLQWWTITKHVKQCRVMIWFVFMRDYFVSNVENGWEEERQINQQKKQLSNFTIHKNYLGNLCNSINCQALFSKISN